ncbi:efflux RND transporter periplasmic adaptor subunit, partial [bacterium]|nr:efflux RND transporter periplasmic adaptor subunit [bacterium]
MNRKTLHGARLCVRSLFLIAALALVALAVACSAAEQPPVAVASETAKAPATRPAKADPADWCKGHGVPESMCTRCNPELVEPFKKSGDWCAEHGYPESVCPTCNPMDPPKPAGEAAAAPSMQVAAADPSDWCKGHSVPESKCTICNPELIPKFKEAGDWCEEHGLPESVCPQCTTKPVTSAIEPGTRVRFKSAQIESAAGIETVAARTLELGDEIACVGRVEYDGNRYADVRSTTAGIVRRVHVSPGDRVRRGQALFELESVDVGDAQGRLATARERFETDRARHERLETLHARQMVSDEERDRSAQRLAAAGAEMRSAESALRITGAPASRHDGRFVLRAPIDGIVVARD